jgi:hypothetical protein
MIPAEQLQRFSRECLLLRKALQDGTVLTELDYRILRSNISMLLSDLERHKQPDDPPPKAGKSTQKK